MTDLITLTQKPGSMDVEMFAHSTIPYRLSTPSTDSEIIAAVEDVSAAAKKRDYIRQFQGDRSFGWHSEDIDEETLLQLFTLLHGAVRHPSTAVRKAAYATIKQIALDVKAQQYDWLADRERPTHQWMPEVGSQIAHTPFYGMMPLIQHAGADPDMEAVEPLFDHPKPDSPPETVEELYSEPAVYWAHLLISVFHTPEGRGAEWFLVDTAVWENLNPSLLRSGLLTPRSETAPGLPSGSGSVHSWGILSVCDRQGTSACQVMPTRSEDTLNFLQHRFAAPLCASMTSDDNAAFHEAVSRYPAWSWQRVLYHKPTTRRMLRRCEITQTDVPDMKTPEGADAALLKELLGWWDSDWENLIPANEYFEHLMPHADDSVARSALLLRSPQAAAEFAPLLWKLPAVSDHAGAELLGRWFMLDTEEADTGIDLPSVDGPRWDMNPMIGELEIRKEWSSFTRFLLKCKQNAENSDKRRPKSEMLPKIQERYKQLRRKIRDGVLPLDETFYAPLEAE